MPSHRRRNPRRQKAKIGRHVVIASWYITATVVATRIWKSKALRALFVWTQNTISPLDGRNSYTVYLLIKKFYIRKRAFFLISKQKMLFTWPVSISQYCHIWNISVHVNLLNEWLPPQTLYMSLIKSTSLFPFPLCPPTSSRDRDTQTSAAGCIPAAWRSEVWSHWAVLLWSQQDVGG